VVPVFLNPTAGGGKSQDLAPRLTELFAAAGCRARVVTLATPGLTDSAVRSARAEGADTIVAAGGDGTVSAVASALLGLDGRLGVVPLGTLNHFARDLGIPTDLGDAVKTIVGGRTIAVDVGDANGRPFLNNSSIGIYPDIVLEREERRKRGYRKWTAFAIATAKVLSRYPGLVVRITAGDATQSIRTPFLFVGNNEYQVEGIRVGSRTSLNRGHLFACLAPRLRARDVPVLAALALAGRAKANPSLSSFCAISLQVDTPGRGRIRVAIDGEVQHMTTPLQYSVRPGALSVLVPGE
jgi:YegS/Rv2252/BmrU family lipid kinase